MIGIVPPSSVRKEIGNLISWISLRFGLIFDISFSVLDLILCVYLKLLFLNIFKLFCSINIKNELPRDAMLFLISMKGTIPIGEGTQNAAST